MASFTDTPVEFTPYVAQQPIEAMVRVGMEREQEFRKGIDIVQSIYDSYLSLPIAKEGVRDYVKQKVGQLNEAVGQSISGDFSSRRLTNQIAGLASQISADPIVQNGIQATARIQSGLAKQKADQELLSKSGKTPTNNINDYNERISAYLSDGDLRSSFNDDYTPYVDVIDRALKLFKEQNQGQTLDVDAFYKDPNDLNTDGSPKLKANPIYFKGVGPERVQAVLNMVNAQPDVQAQFGVDGRQRFKGMDKIGMSHFIEDGTNSKIDFYQSQMNKLAAEKNTNANADVQAINADIEMYTKKHQDVLKEFKTNDDLLKIEGGEEILKIKLVKEGFEDNFIQAYSYKDPTESPLFKAQMDQEKWGWTKKKDIFDMNVKSKEFDLKVDEFNLNKLKVQLDNTKKNSTPFDAFSTAGVDQSQGNYGLSDAENDLSNAQVQMTQSLRAATAIASRGMKDTIPPYVEVDGVWVPNINRGEFSYKDMASLNNATVTINDAMARNHSLGNDTGLPSGEAWNEFQKSSANYESKKAIISNLEKQFAPDIAKMKSLVKNPDLVDAYIVYNKLSGWENAEKSLKRKYEKDDKFSWERRLGLVGETVTFGTVTNTGKGHNEEAYKDVEKIIEKNVDIPDFKKRYSDAYRRASYTTANKVATIDGQSKDYSSVMGKIGALAQAAMNVPGAATSDVEAFQKAQLGSGDKRNEFTNVHVMYDAAKQQGFVTGYLGKEAHSFAVNEDTFFQVFPEFQPDPWFEENFRPVFNKASTTGTPNTTDVGNRGRLNNSFTIPNPDYIVQYHLDGNTNNRYNIRYWITPKKQGSAPIVDGQSFFSVYAPIESVKEAITKELAAPSLIQALVQKAQLPK